MDHASPHATLLPPSPTQLRDDYLEFVLKSFVPQKVKIFGRLLALDRLNTWGNLHHKTFNRRMFFLVPA
jgi:hypothetical protein